MTDYRNNVLAIIERALNGLNGLTSALDFGAGDGWYAMSLVKSGRLGRIETVDVKLRAHVHIVPRLYDGTTLPYADASFDLAYAVDVLHHCPNPKSAIEEIMRVARRYILIKDHRCTSLVGRYTLAILDELGNRRFGIPSTYRYQQHWEWDAWLAEGGWRKVWLEYPATCHKGLLGRLTNNLQYVAVYEKNP